MSVCLYLLMPFDFLAFNYYITLEIPSLLNGACNSSFFCFFLRILE